MRFHRSKNMLVNLFGSNYCQNLLEKNVAISQYLMGIGANGSPAESGEKILVTKLKQHYSKVKRPLNIIDAGANKGFFSTLIANGMNKLNISFNIHAFEPGRGTFEILYNTFKEHPNILLNNFGLGKVTGELDLHYNKTGSGLASLYNRRLNHFGVSFDCSEKVQIRKLDDYCSENRIEAIDLLKLDVEGHELDILLGASSMFKERKIKMVSFEFGGCNIDSRTYFQDFWYFFQENEMGNIYRITPSGSLSPILQYKELYEQFRTTNFLVMQTE